MDNIRKMFERVEVTSASADFPLMVARNLARRMELMATISVSEHRAHHGFALLVNVSPEALTFEVLDSSDDNVVVKRSELILSDIPEWPVYVSKSVVSLSGTGTGEIESFLQNAFSLAQPSPLQKTVTNMGERIGVRVGNDLLMSLADGPYDLESKEIYSNLAHLALTVSPRMTAILQAEEKFQQHRKEQYDAEATKPLILP